MNEVIKFYGSKSIVWFDFNVSEMASLQRINCQNSIKPGVTDCVVNVGIDCFFTLYTKAELNHLGPSFDIIYRSAVNV
jgi:hypothetical protein